MAALTGANAAATIQAPRAFTDSLRPRREEGRVPHVTLEVTDNLVFDASSLLARLHDELAASGAVRLATIKSRVLRIREWRMADGDPSYAFAHLTIAVKEGRPLAVQQDLADRASAVLEAVFAERLAVGGVSLSVDVRELRDAVGRTSRSIPGAS